MVFLFVGFLIKLFWWVDRNGGLCCEIGFCMPLSSELWVVKGQANYYVPWILRCYNRHFEGRFS